MGYFSCSDIKEENRIPHQRVSLPEDGITHIVFDIIIPIAVLGGCAIFSGMLIDCWYSNVNQHKKCVEACKTGVVVDCNSEHVVCGPTVTIEFK